MIAERMHKHYELKTNKQKVEDKKCVCDRNKKKKRKVVKEIESNSQ